MPFLPHSYDLSLVSLSVVIALLASYTALDLVGRIRAAEGNHAYGWLLAGALSMGSGIWSMHFVGMLAFQLPMEMGYRIDVTALSWLCAVVGSLIALYLASASQLTRARYLCGTISMASAIVSMHYLGMAAMAMTPTIVYDPYWVTISILIALGASAAALYVGFNLRAREVFVRKASAAVLLGFAIAGMHYAGMQAAGFPYGSICGAANSIDDNWLALLIANTTILLLACMLTAIALDRRLENRTAQFVHSLQAANFQLHHASRHDPLTNLGNRQLLRERLELAIESAEFQGAELALIYLDVDDFKSFNDNIGHDYGDEILKWVGAALAQTVRSGDTAVRIGGDEFVLLITTETGAASLRQICRQLLVAVRGVDVGQAQLSASIGVARYPTDGTTAPALMKSSDLAMYSAKNQGKNRYAFFTPDLAEALDREFAIQHELTEAIEASQIKLYYQPKYDVNTRRVVGAEALARWQHPTAGFVTPGHFIAVAERSNQIGNLQTGMLRQVCTDMKAWRARGLHVPPVAVNLSALSLRNVELPDMIAATLRDFGLAASDLICEITETAALPELEHTLATLRGLREHGIRIALDDFGTGLSSMSYLRDLPVDELKIDRAFIAQLGAENDHQTMIVHAIINLAHSLNLRVVAEGVEREVQLEQLERLKCDQVQGYLFSCAVPADEFAGFLAGASSSGSSIGAWSNAKDDFPGPI